MLRVCAECGDKFYVEYLGRGRPKSFCKACVPEGLRRIGKAVNEPQNRPDIRSANDKGDAA